MERHGESRRINTKAVGIIYFTLFLVTLVVDRHRRILRFPSPASPNFVRDLLIDSAFGVLIGAAIAGLSWWVARRVESLARLAGEFRALLGRLTGEEIFFLSLFSAVGEEYFFRGLVQGWFGWTAASLLFGLLHSGPSTRFVPWTLFATAIGFLLGGLYEWRGDLLTPILAHFTVNFLNLRVIRGWREMAT